MSYRYTLECEYCGHTWTKLFFGEPDEKYLHCEKCKDKHVAVKPHKSTDYYENKKK